MVDFDALKAEGRWFEAAALYADALSQNILSASNWVQLGHALKEAGAREEAEASYRSAIACDGAEPDPWLHLGHLLKMQNRFEDALTTFETLSAFPHPPDVSQEIRGLKVTLLPENRVLRRAATAGTKSKMPVGLKEALEHKQSRLRSALAASEKASGAAAAFSTSLQRRRGLKAKLVPIAHLVVRDGVFVATTTNPQFDIVLENSITGEWVEIELGIVADVPFIEPVLLIEHAPHWQQFSFARLRPRNGRFYAICFLKQPALSLRLNPLGFEGAFHVTYFALRPISIFKAIEAARELAPGSIASLLASGHQGRSFRTFKQNLANRLAYPCLDAYQRWVAMHPVTQMDWETQRRDAANWPTQPIFSVLLVYDPSDCSKVEATIASLKAQSYPLWSLSVVSSRSLSDVERRYLEASCGGLSDVSQYETLASAVSELSHEYVVALHAGNLMSRAALFRFAEAVVVRGGPDLIYCDEDFLRDGKRCDPLFKPDWDPDFQEATRYVGDFVAIRRGLLKDAYLQQPLSDETWVTIVSRIVEEMPNSNILHLDEVLHHRQFLHARLKNYDEIISSPPSCQAWPNVSLIIPTRDSVDLLRQCITSLRSITDYPNFEILVVDNESTEPETLSYLEDAVSAADVSVIRVPGQFNFSRLNNKAIDHARGSFIGMINNDILAIKPDWLKIMVAEAMRPEIGAVGAKLVYPSGHVQHAGIACGVGLVAAHPHKFRAGNDAGYMDRLVAKHRVSAVTAACLIVEKRKYLEVGGMDEDYLKIAFNDVDLCLKLDRVGYHNLLTPRAVLVHLETATRGLDLTAEKAARYLKEAEFMSSRWSGKIERDPYYNVNLTHSSEDYSVRN